MKKYIQFENRGIIGYVEGDIFYSERDSRLHYFRNFMGWGQSVPILAHLQSLNVNSIVFKVDKWKTIKTKLMNFYYFGKKYTDTSAGKEDVQLILIDKYWAEEGTFIETQDKLIK